MLNRILLLATALLAGYQVAVGIEGIGAVPILAYTVGFGIILLACLLILIFGTDILEAPLVVVVASVIPLSLSTGLVWEYAPGRGGAYAGFVVLALAAISATRFATPGRPAVVVLASGHAVAGLVITGLPIVLAIQGRVAPGFALVGLGGALIGVGGLLLAMLRTGRPVLPKETLLGLIPGLLLAMTAAFVAGFVLG
jgi:hypothetical protein